jgi:hypothetical protein
VCERGQFARSSSWNYEGRRLTAIDLFLTSRSEELEFFLGTSLEFILGTRRPGGFWSPEIEVKAAR